MESTPAPLQPCSPRSIIRVLFLAACLASSLAPNTSQAAIDRDEAQELLREARARISEGRVPEAINLFRRVTGLMPGEPNVRKELARLLASHNETRSEAEKVYAEAVVIVPNDASLALERAGNLSFLGDYVNASIEYRRAFELKPDDGVALAGYVQQIARLGSSLVAITRVSDKLAATPRDIASRVILAELFRDIGRYDNALDQFSLVQKNDPQNLIALRGIAEIWLSLGFYNRAAESFQQADVKAGRGLFLANQARVLLASGQHEAALRMLNNSVADVDKEPLALVVLADSYRASNKSAQEQATLEKLLNLFPTLPHSALERLARVRFELGDKKASIETCRQLLNYDPQNTIGAVGLSLNGDQPGLQKVEDNSLTPTRRAAKEHAEAEAAIFWNQPDRAIAILSKALLVRDDCPRLLLEFATTLLRRGDTEEALKAFARIAISNGKWPEALSGMAEAERMRRNPLRALNFNAEILKIDPTNVRALSGQADNVYQLGNFEKAASLLNDLQKRFPDSIEISEHLREALSSIGRNYKKYESKLQSSPDKDNLAESPKRTSQSVSIKPVLGAGDVVKISVTGRSNLNSEIRLDDSGMVTLPFLTQPIHAACLTEQELSTLITNYGGARLAATPVSTTITEFYRKSLEVSGAVYLPGRFNIRKSLGLNEALMLASGADRRAGRIVYVVREDDSCGVRRQGQNFDGVEAYERSEIEKGSVILTRPLKAGDAVIVPEEDSVFIVGEVARPGATTLSNRLRLLEALKQSGGVLPGARRDYLKLTRLMPVGIQPQQFIINLDDIEQSRTGDVILLPGDIIEVTSRNRNTTNSLGSRTSNSTAGKKPVAAMEVEPPVKQTPESLRVTSVSKPLTKSLAAMVLNGKAIDLPSPVYPELARRRRATGLVVVEVMIDVNGKVLSAKALSGNSALKDAAVQAALRARFSPTTLSGQPIKVAGVIKYNFDLLQ